MSARVDRWRSRPRAWVLTAAGCAGVVGLVGWPWPTLYALVPTATAILLLVFLRILFTARRAPAEPWPCDDCGATVPPGCAWCAAPGCPDPERIADEADRARLVRVEIDLNVRLGDGTTRAGIEDADGELVVGQRVIVYESESGLTGPGLVMRVDQLAGLAYLAVDWRQLTPEDTELTAQEARDLAEDLGLQLYRARDALAFVAEMCDLADEHRGVRGEPATVTTARVRDWLRGAQCAREAGLVLHPDASGRDPEPVRMLPDEEPPRTAEGSTEQ